MLNLLYMEYPYGRSEAFVEYEMRELSGVSKEISIYVLTHNDAKDPPRFVPANARVIPLLGHRKLLVLFLSFCRMFTKASLKELLGLLKNPPPEGMLRSIYRVYCYHKAAVALRLRYKEQKDASGDDIFVSYWLNECAYALTELKKKYPKIRIASRGHGFDVFEDRCYLPFRKQTRERLDRIFLINRAEKRYFEEKYGSWLDLSKVEISHLGVDLPTSLPAWSDPSVFRVVTCSSVIPLKRLDLMVEALSGITDKTIEWVHLGGGPLLEDIKALAEEKLKNSSVRFTFFGQLPLEKIHEYYKATPVHLFVNCSDTEGTPVSIMEAMSYGIPAVAREVGGNDEVVDDECGRLLPPEANARALRTAIEGIVSLPSQVYGQMRQNARRKIELEFDASVTYKAYIEKVCSL